jgi:segregation and condensation protein B
MQQNELPQVIEAILFVAGEPVLIQDLQKALDISDMEISAAVDALERDLSAHRRGICLKRFGAHIQLSTRTEYAPYVERMLQPIQRMSLSQAALETLAIIAYRQPVTRLDVESIRGVKCDYSIASLANKQLIEEKGRKETLGRPILYGTTDAFLSHFGLGSIQDLPKPPEANHGDGDESIMIP